MMILAAGEDLACRPRATAAVPHAAFSLRIITACGGGRKPARISLPVHTPSCMSWQDPCVVMVMRHFLCVFWGCIWACLQPRLEPH